MSEVETNTENYKPDSQAKSDYSKPKLKIRELIVLFKGQGTKLFGVANLGILSAVALLIQPNIVGNLLDSFDGDMNIYENIWMLIGVLALTSVMMIFQYYLLQNIAEIIVSDTRKGLIHHLFRLPISEYDTRSVGDLISRATSDTSRLKTAIIQGSLAISNSTVLVIGAIIGMAIKDFILFIVSILVISFTFIIIVLLSKLIQRYSFKAQCELGNLSGFIERDLHAIRTIRAANATGSEEEKAYKKIDYLLSIGLKLAKIQAVINPVSNMCLLGCGLIVISVGGFRVASGLITVSSMISFMLLLYILIAPVGQILSAFAAIGESLGAFVRIQEIIDINLEKDSEVEISAKDFATMPRTEKNSAIFLNNISFAYKKRKFSAHDTEVTCNTVLKDIVLNIQRGSKVAFVGPSGAGKSTLLDLIERFYDPDEGQIFVNGNDYRKYSRTELRRIIAYVSQDAPILSGTLRDNLLLVNCHATDAECLDVIKTVNLEHLLSRTNEQLDSNVGEGGIALSGGERQRIAIARALLATSEIIIFDESTSNLDSINELAIKKAIDSLRNIKTVVIVAHRLSTVVDADKIFVLANGTIVGEGSHYELLDNLPLYRNLAREQIMDTS